jgi:cytoskeletal protein RodZ
MDSNKLRKKLGELIRKKRESIGISQEALAADIGIHRNYIGSIEREQFPLTS